MSLELTHLLQGMPIQSNRGVSIVTYLEGKLDCYPCVSKKELVYAYMRPLTYHLIQLPRSGTIPTGHMCAAYLLTRPINSRAWNKGQELEAWLLKNHNKSLSEFATPAELIACKRILNPSDDAQSYGLYLGTTDKEMDAGKHVMPSVRKIKVRDIGIDKDDAAGKWLADHGF
jgi:hypothetical protein